MKKGGLTAENVEAKLRELNGNLAAVGRHFGVTRQAVHDFVRKRPTLVSAANDVRESFKDNAESSLHRAVLAGEAWAVCFFLKTQAKDRGYVEKQEVEHQGAGGGPLVREVQIEHHAATKEQPAAGGSNGGPASPSVPSGPDAGLELNGSLPSRLGGHP